LRDPRRISRKSEGGSSLFLICRGKCCKESRRPRRDKMYKGSVEEGDETVSNDLGGAAVGREKELDGNLFRVFHRANKADGTEKKR